MPHLCPVAVPAITLPRLKVFLRETPGFLRRIPFREVWVVVVLCLVIREQYPFSNFPMYSSLANQSIYHAVVNSRGELLPYVPTFRLRASHASKILETKRKMLRKEGVPDAEAMNRAGIELLEFLLDRSRPEKRDALRNEGLQLFETRIFVANRELQEKKTLIAELP